MADKSHTSEFAKAYYALNNSIVLDCGLTDRQRAREMIVVVCQLSARSFFRLLKNSELLNELSYSEKYHLSLVLNKPIKEIFKK